MVQLLNYFIGGFFLVIATYYVAIKITGRKFQIFKFSVIRWLLLETLIFIFLYIWNFSNIFRISFNILIIMLFYKLIFKDSIVKNMIVSFFTFSVVSLAEYIFLVLNKIFSFFILNGNYSSIFITIYTNVFVGIIIMIIVNIKYVNCIFKIIINDDLMEKHYEIIFLMFSFSICLSSLIYYTFFEINKSNSMFITFILLLCYISFPVLLLKEKNEKEKLKIEYGIVLKNIDDYEYNLEDQRIRNHENKNVLISIKGMIQNKDEDTINFINQILNENKLEENQDILSLTKNIPIGGLQGLIYQKLVIMNNKKIHFNVNVDKNIKNSMFKSISINTMKNICMIVGVFLDNAIDEVDNQTKKLIGINLYKNQNSVVIEISNNYRNIKNINLFDKKGFTTKSKGHGYGLSLVRELIEKDENLTNIKLIVGDIFIQKLIINI